MQDETGLGEAGAETRVQAGMGYISMGGATETRGDFIQTFSGIAFYPNDPRADEISIIDIAHALAHQCRYGGHTSRFYSVAEHCVIMWFLVPESVAFEALMHDAAEAYLVDVPRPIKRYLVGYREMEAKIEAVIAQKFGLSWPWPNVVMEIDTRILNDERRQLMKGGVLDWAPCGDPLNIAVDCWAPDIAERRFLDRFAELAR